MRGWSSDVNIGLAVTRSSLTTSAKVRYRSHRTEVADSAAVISAAVCCENHSVNKPGQRVTVPVPLPLVGEVGAERLSQCGNGLRRSGEFGQVAEVAAGECDDHERHAVVAGELLAVLAVDRVADPFARGAIHHHLGEEAEVARRRQRDVLQRNADPLALLRWRRGAATR